VLPPEFWARFAEQHWEREPGVFRDCFPGPLLTPEEAFDGLVTAFPGDSQARPLSRVTAD